MTTKYNTLLSLAKEMMCRLELHYQEHQQHSTLYQECQDWVGRTSYKAIYRMSQKHRMTALTQTNAKANMTLRMLMGLALLPANDIPVGLEVVRFYLRQNHLYGSFRALMGLTSVWRPRPC